MRLKRYAAVGAALFVVDWLLGMGVVRGLLPLWTFLVVNFPFAGPHVWLESHWVGTRYEVGGRVVDELWSLVAFLFMVGAQAWLYCSVYGMLKKRRHLRAGPRAAAS